ncbi:hypothetical protein MSSD1_415 [Mycoplasmopsis synoviae]
MPGFDPLKTEALSAKVSAQTVHGNEAFSTFTPSYSLSLLSTAIAETWNFEYGE